MTKYATDKLQDLITARDAVNAARKVECTCSSGGASYQIDGCSCSRIDQIHDADRAFWKLIEEL